MRRHVLQCSIAGLAILAVLIIALAWLPIQSGFKAECERIGGSFAPGMEGAADLCIAPAG